MKKKEKEIPHKQNEYMHVPESLFYAVRMDEPTDISRIQYQAHQWLIWRNNTGLEVGGGVKPYAMVNEKDGNFILSSGVVGDKRIKVPSIERALTYLTEKEKERIAISDKEKQELLRKKKEREELERNKPSWDEEITQ